MTAYEKLLNCLRQVREKTDFVPRVALVLTGGTLTAWNSGGSRTGM